MSAVTRIDCGRRQNAAGHAGRQSGEFALLQVALPGAKPRNAGVFLLDPASGELYTRMRGEWQDVSDADDRELLELLDLDIRLKAKEIGGAEFLRSLEDTLSNTLRITPRERVEVTGFAATLERLYAEHVEAHLQANAIREFVTHLPMYSLQAAAGKFGEDRAVEPEGWVQAPKRLRLNDNMFVARVVGRSMEPRIADGSLCVFRAGVVGSRQGKLVLVERMGATDIGARYTVKKYTSTKAPAGKGEDASWQHTKVRLEPLNPEFEGFDLEEGTSRVIAKFVQVLD
jgi:phage repressor protein C with HTH and peptisase S24 domain